MTTGNMSAMGSGDEHVAEVMRGLVRHLNCLNEDNKATRKRALEAIKKETIEKGLSGGVLQEVFSCLLKPLLKCMSDPMERCRETSILMLTDFIRCVPQPEDSLVYLMPCLTQRLGGKEIIEPAEELRLSIMELLSLTVEVCGKQLAPYLDDMIKILQVTIVDPCPDVKRESCKCTVLFAKSVPEHFHMQAESLVKPLMQSISHQHSRVRVSVLEATGAVVQHGTGKNVDDVLSHMAQRLFDNSPQVRKSVTIVVGDWLLNMRDRYSYFHKLIPLLLSSITDEVDEIRLLAEELWRKTGEQWERENEADIKDKMDFLLAPPPLYPAGVERPGLGCRELVVRNLGRLVPAVSHDVTDWLVPTRVKTSQLLRVLLLHAEDHCTQHMQPLLATLHVACGDSEREVVANCREAAKLLGFFVLPEVFLQLLLDHVEASGSSRSPWTPLMVLAAALEGSSGPLLGPHLQRLADTLARPDVCQESQQPLYLEQLVACVDALLTQLGRDCGTVSLQLLQVLLTVQSLSTEQVLSDMALGSVRRLCQVQGLAGVPELYRQHMAQLLGWLLASARDWSGCSPQRLQLQIIAEQSGPVLGEFVGQLMALLQVCLQPTTDPEMRLSIFTMLAKLLLDVGSNLDSQGCFGAAAEGFLCEVLLPNLVWQGGRTAGALRTAALSCLLALLHGGSLTPGQLLCVEQKLCSTLLGGLEESSPTARLFACRCLSLLLAKVGASLHPDALNKIYPELVKRLDDSSDQVRAVALKALGLWLSSLGEDYHPHLYGAHLEFLFQQLLLHLDDPDGSVQEQVLGVLKAGSRVHPALLERETQAAKDKQRSPAYCEQLLLHIHSLPRGGAVEPAQPADS
ncbi:dynein assembly factor 5, axonemal [Gadus morhua]|uniref:Dynein axonemal assembly factor 5 n=1 Tax=Gadus morhua TaxID=8049 RepID=A0A8C5FLT2_GADMO|nr:dynein assembly factor 5, axonemal [Gadus morhua]